MSALDPLLRAGIAMALMGLMILAFGAIDRWLRRRASAERSFGPAPGPDAASSPGRSGRPGER